MGREAEYDQLRAAIRDATAANGTSVAPSLIVIEGATGTGKTFLTDAVVGDLGEDLEVLRVIAAESETGVEFGVLERLAADNAIVLDDTVRPWRSGRRPHPADVGLALLEGIRARAALRPLVIIVDDAQWSDRVSLEIFAYLARRLGALRAGLVVLQRSTASASEALERAAQTLGATRIPLDGLSVPELHRMLAANRTPVTRRTASRLHEHTGGNPSHALMLVRELGIEQLSRGDTDLPAPRSYRTVVGMVFADSDPEVRAVVAAVAVLGAAVPMSAIRSVSGISEPLPAIDRGVESGLLTHTTRIGRRLVDVAHPLVRSVVTDELPLSLGAELHDRAAALTADPARQMLHRLAASTETSVAREAIAVANTLNTHGWDLTAAELFVRAADLLNPGPERASALLAAADIVLTHGETAWAEVILGTVGDEIEHVGTNMPMGIHSLVRGHLALLKGEGDVAARLIARAWEAPGDEQVATRAAELLAIFASDIGDGGLTTMWATRAIEAAAETPTELRFASIMLATGWAMRGDLETGRERVTHHLRGLAGSANEADALLARGLLDLWDGRFDDALATYRPFDARDDRVSAVARMSARVSLADVLYRRGDWDDSLEVTEEDIAVIDDGWETLGAPLTLAVSAFVLSARGDWDEAARRIDRAEAGLGAANFTGRLWVAVARGRLAAARGEASGVVDALAPIRARIDRTQLPEGYQPWRAELVQALVRLGRLDDAAEVLRVAESRIDHGGGHALIGIRRATGLLAAARDDVSAAAEVFDTWDDERWTDAGVFERARFALAAGAFERRRGSRRRAIDRLEFAVDGFTGLGARPFTIRARAELGLSTSTKRTRNGRFDLTPAEEGVARLVAAGGTNREIAEELAVSVKTVESHLSRIFTKLSVRHRVEMVTAWQRLH